MVKNVRNFIDSQKNMNSEFLDAKKTRFPSKSGLFGGDKRDRTADLLNAIQDRRVKFLSGAGLWYIVALMVLITKKKTEKWSFKRIFNNFCSTVLCVGIGSGIGWVFTLIPTLGLVGVNVGLTIILEVIVLWLLIEKPKK